MNFGADDNTGLPEDSGTLRGFAVVNELREAYPDAKKSKWPWVVIVLCLLLFGAFVFGLPAYVQWKQSQEPPPKQKANAAMVCLTEEPSLEEL